MRSEGLGSLIIFWDWLGFREQEMGVKRLPMSRAKEKHSSVGNVAASESLASSRVSGSQMDRKHSE